MTSQKQLQANRRNSTKSTGPKTRAGKAQSRLNSRKHGLTAKLLITAGENGADFDQLRAELLEEFHAKSALRIELVDRLAGILWRLRRVPFFEAAILAARNAEISEQEGDTGTMESQRSLMMKRMRKTKTKSPTGRRRSSSAKP